MDWSQLTADAGADLSDSQEESATAAGGWSFGDLLTRGFPAVIDAAARYRSASSMGVANQPYAAGQNGQQYAVQGAMPAPSGSVAGLAGALQGSGMLIAGAAVLVVVLLLVRKG